VLIAFTLLLVVLLCSLSLNLWLLVVGSKMAGSVHDDLIFLKSLTGGTIPPAKPRWPFKTADTSPIGTMSLPDSHGFSMDLPDAGEIEPEKE
jgi:hypothetical protein